MIRETDIRFAKAMLAYWMTRDEEGLDRVAAWARQIQRLRNNQYRAMIREPFIFEAAKPAPKKTETIDLDELFS